MIIFANVKRRWAEILAVLCVCTAWGQSTIGDMPMFRYNFNQDLKSKVLPLPATVNPALRPTLPTPGMTRQPEPLKLDYRLSHIADSMPQVTSAGYLTTPPPPQYDFHGNPYARDWASSGVIAHVGTGYISGAGSYTSYPAMGTIGSATLAITQPIGDRFTITAGITGNKYHFGREAWNAPRPCGGKPAAHLLGASRRRHRRRAHGPSRLLRRKTVQLGCQALTCYHPT